ncbi:MAG: hypothetical protein IJN42_02570 [Clostridia bacterium]|nr:hypothetical protein [Clostridia bacterium]
MRYYAPRRSYAAPSIRLLGGGAPEGMDTVDCFLPAERAQLAENLWREADGCVAKRPGYRLLSAGQIPGKVVQTYSFGGITFLHYIDETGQGILRRITASGPADRVVKMPLRMLGFGKRLLILTPGEWLIVQQDGSAKALYKNGIADVGEDWSSTGNIGWTLGQKMLTVPLICSGTSPTGKGQKVQPPNELVPLVQESFVYGQSHQEAKRNRFCLQNKPEILGDLPVDANGTTDGITAAQQTVRVATLQKSAKLEIRLLRTDRYGNVTDYWTEYKWGYEDNISHADAAFWVHAIHQENLAFDGDDNLRITYYTDFESQKTQAEKILQTTCHTLYGVDGRKDRLFAADENAIYYSAMDDPLYFSRLQRIVLGDGEIGIRLLAGEDTVMTVLTDNGAWRIVGQAENEAGEYALDAYFTVSLRLPSPKPTGRNCIIAGGELLFYSEEGLCAITPSGVLDERCVQIRSRRLEGLLRKENPANIKLHSWQNWVFLAGERGIYLLDLQRRIKVTGDAYSTHGYEGYFWPDILVDCFVQSERLEFYSEGNHYGFTDGSRQSDFHDEYLARGTLQSRAISAVWKSGKLIGKTDGCQWFRALIVHCDGPTSLRVEADTEQGTRVLHTYSGALGVFRYGWLYYGQLYYGTVARNVCRLPLNLSHCNSLRLHLTNDVPDQPFRLQSFIIEYQ